MEILEVDASYYSSIIPVPYYIYGSAAFNEVSKDKCDGIHYLLFRESKYRLGIIGGSRGNVYYSPFSAPFGGFVFLSENVRLQYIEDALTLLEKWAMSKGFVSINITLPPSLYNNTFISKQTNCLFRKGYDIFKIDLNYSFNLNELDEKYRKRIWHNARKNLQTAEKSDLHFMKCETESEKRCSFDIIKKNRIAKRYPLRMNWQQVYDTVQVIPADFFMIYNDGQVPIASAIIFHINDSVVQVVYWGDLLKYSELKTMNYLSYKVFEYYKSTTIQKVDIGPSSEDSLPNYGLCEFKESIGSHIFLKLTFTKQIN